MRVLLPIAALVLLIASACGADSAETDDTETPTPRPPGGAVPTMDLPAATLDAGAAGSIEGGAGTHCWTFAGGMGRCVDFIGPISNADPFPVGAGQSLTIEFEAGPPGELSATWFDVEGAQSEVVPGGRAWHNVYEGFIAPGLQPTGATVEAPDEPGEYLLGVFARWAEGDISYGFYLRVD